MNTGNDIKSPKRKLKVWKYIKRILLSILIFFLLLIGSAFIIVFFYQDSIKKYIVDQINKQLVTEIKVKEVELSLFQKFPYVSLTFTDVTAKDAIKSANKGELLRAENVFLEFNIWDLFYKNYRIRKIEVKNAFVNLMVYQDGSDNYHFWKVDTVPNKSFSFDLQKVALDNVNIRYKNFYSNQDYSAIARDMLLKGKFASDHYTMYVNGDLFVNYLDVSGVSYFPARNSSIDLVLNVDQNTDTYTFDEGGINFGNLKFDVKGNVVYSDKKHMLDLEVKGADLKLQSILDEVPVVYKKYFDTYSGKGELYFTAGIKGSFKGNDLPVVNINFGISKGQIVKKESDIALEDVSFTGEFTNGNAKTVNSCVLKINNFHSKLHSGIFEGNLTLSNFLQPELSLVLYSKMDMKDLQDFLKFDTISSVSGNLEMKVSFHGQVGSSGHFTAKDFIASTTSGSLRIGKVNISIINDPKKYTNINGEFQFSNNDLIVNKLSGIVLNSDFLIKGYFHNLLSYIFLKDQKLYIDADLTSVNIDLAELLETSTSASDTTYKLSFSDKIDMKMNVNIGKLEFHKFMASNITGSVRLKNMQLLASPLSFNSMDGSISGLVMVDASQTGKLLISCDAKINKVNVTKLFYEFGNFGQNSMKDVNLKGKITSDVQFAGVWSSNLKPDIPKMYASADIKIEDGELLNYEPMKGLSRFLKVSDLDDVKFATLHNHIEVKDRVVHIPAMEIKSSALNIIASGEHTFDNAIDYHLCLLLSQVLSQKAKKAKKENEEFGVVEDDGLGKTNLYISISGTIDNPVYTYDAKGVKAKLAIDIIKEKQNLKTILNDEFGWFKKDSAVIKNKEKNDKTELKLPKKQDKKDREKEKLRKQEEGKYIIEWGEDTVGKGN
jgi:hypothetical protein